MRAAGRGKDMEQRAGGRFRTLLIGMGVVLLPIVAGRGLCTLVDKGGTEPGEHSGIARMPVSRARVRTLVMIAPGALNRNFRANHVDVQVIEKIR